MAEYMDYDDTLYDGVDHKNKRKSIVSTISVILSAAVLISLIVLVIVRDPETVRTRFSTVTSERHRLNNNVKDAQNEFVYVYSRLQEGTLPFDKAFEREYPKMTQVLTMDRAAISLGKVQSFDNGGTLTLVLPYIISADSTAESGNRGVFGTLGADILVLSYKADETSLHIGDLLRYSVKFTNPATGGATISSEYVSTDRFRLNFYTLGVNVYAAQGKKISTATAKLTLSDGISKANSASQVFYNSMKCAFSAKTKKTFGGERGDNYVTKQFTLESPSDFAHFSVDFDDTVYAQFNSFSLDISNADSFEVTVN